MRLYWYSDMICIHTQRCTVKIYQSHPYLIDKHRGYMLHPNHRTPTIHHSSMPPGAHLEVTISMEGRTISPSGTKPWGHWSIHPWAHPKVVETNVGPQSFLAPNKNPWGFFFGFFFVKKNGLYSISNRIVTTFKENPHFPLNHFPPWFWEKE